MPRKAQPHSELRQLIDLLLSLEDQIAALSGRIARAKARTRKWEAATPLSNRALRAQLARDRSVDQWESQIFSLRLRHGQLERHLRSLV
jgi:hypothetical protein